MSEAKVITGGPAELASLAYQSLMNRDLDWLEIIGLDEDCLTPAGPGRYPSVPSLYPPDFEEDLDAAFTLLASDQPEPFLALDRYKVTFGRTAPEERTDSGIGLVDTDTGLNLSLRLGACRLIELDSRSETDKKGVPLPKTTYVRSVDIPLSRNILTPDSKGTHERLIPLARGNLMDGERLLVVGSLSIASYLRNGMNANSVFAYDKDQEIANAAKTRSRMLARFLDEVLPEDSYARG